MTEWKSKITEDARRRMVRMRKSHMEQRREMLELYERGKGRNTPVPVREDADGTLTRGSLL